MIRFYLVCLPYWIFVDYIFCAAYLAANNLRRISTTYLRGYWKGSENGRVVTIDQTGTGNKKKKFKNCNCQQFNQYQWKGCFNLIWPQTTKHKKTTAWVDWNPYSGLGRLQKCGRIKSVNWMQTFTSFNNLVSMTKHNILPVQSMSINSQIMSSNPAQYTSYAIRAYHH